MTALDRTPQDVNFLQPVDFSFFVKKLPTTNFFVKGITIPGVSIQEVSMPTPLTRVYDSGEHVSYEPLEVRFLVDENLRNWTEVYAWLKGLGFPDEFGEYAELASVPRSMLGEGLKSELVVGLLDSSRVLNFSFVYHDAFPIALSGMEFRTDDDATRYAEATARFMYTTFDASRV